jgi:hypothetical protein
MSVAKLDATSGDATRNTPQDLQQAPAPEQPPAEGISEAADREGGVTATSDRRFEKHDDPRAIPIRALRFLLQQKELNTTALAAQGNAGPHSAPAGQVSTDDGKKASRLKEMMEGRLIAVNDALDRPYDDTVAAVAALAASVLTDRTGIYW